MLNDEFYNNIYHELKKEIPEFVTILDNDDSVYVILGDFQKFIFKNKNNPIILEKCVKFIDYALDRGKHKTEDAIVIEVFQFMYNDSLLEGFLKRFLNKKNLNIFLQSKEDYKNNT